MSDFMPEKQICGNCGHEEKLHVKDSFGNIVCDKSIDGEHGQYTFCGCRKFEPQILCGKCGKPKGEHHTNGTYFWCTTEIGDNQKFKPKSSRQS